MVQYFNENVHTVVFSIIRKEFVLPRGIVHYHSSNCIDLFINLEIKGDKCVVTISIVLYNFYIKK